MPVTLRKRLDCHYCGQRLATTRASNHGNTHKITCQSCAADNYFDNNGNITDVPLEVITAPRAGTTQNPVEVTSDSSIFCSTCVKNQQLYYTALSEYLPDEDDPQYEELEAALPQYKADLEKRYPQCCARCEPKVNAQLQQANYAAKSDHLRRMLERNHERRKQSRLQWKSLFVSTAGLGHLCSLLSQLAWHLLSSQSNTTEIQVGINPIQCFKTYPVPAQCTNLAAVYLPYSLATGVLCLWWNPKWQHKLMQQDGRLVGLEKYYQFQVFILFFRFAAWALLVDVPRLQHKPAIHSIVFLLTSVLSAYAHLGLIQVDTTPLVDWSKTQPPLIVPGQFQPPTRLHEQHTSSQQDRSLIHNLSGPQSSTPQPWQPPTPPSTQDDMDWAPSQPAFNPRLRRPELKYEQPSPFYGTLPAAPARGSLNPKRPQDQPSQKAIGIPPGFFGLNKPSQSATTDSRAPSNDPSQAFAPAKFFAQEQNADTGLENIFDKIFSVSDNTPKSQSQLAKRRQQRSSHHVHDDPSSVPATHEPQFAYAIATPSTTRTIHRILSCTSVIALSILLVNTIAKPVFTSDIPPIAIDDVEDTVIINAHDTILPYLSIIPVIHIVLTLIADPGASMLALLPLLMEATLLPSTSLFHPSANPSLTPLWEKFTIGTICLLLIQEIYTFAQLQQSSPVMCEHLAAQSQQPPPPKPQPINQQSKHVVQQPHTQPTPFSTQTTTPKATRYSQPFSSTFDPPSPLRNKASTSSIESNASDTSTLTTATTTTTASGWTTPKAAPRSFDFSQHSSRSHANPNTSSLKSQTRSNTKANSGYDWQRRGSEAGGLQTGLGGLSLGGGGASSSWDDDWGLGSSNSVSGPRTRQTRSSGRNGGGGGGGW